MERNKSRLRGRQLTNEQWQAFVNEDDPQRLNRPFLYGLDGRDFQGTLDARMSRPIRQQAENPWIAHLRQFRAQHPEIPFRDVARRARESYASIRPVRQNVRHPREFVMGPTGPVFIPRTRAHRQRMIDDPIEDRAAAVPLSGAPPVDF